MTHVFIGNQIRIPLTVTRFDILQAVPFFRRRIESLAQDCEISHAQRDFTGAGAEKLPCRLDEITQVVELQKVLERFVPNIVPANVELDFARAVAKMSKDRLALVPPADKSPD